MFDSILCGNELLDTSMTAIGYIASVVGVFGWFGGDNKKAAICFIVYSITALYHSLNCDPMALEILIFLVVILVLAGFFLGLYSYRWWKKRNRMKEKIRIAYLTSDLDMALGLTGQDLKKVLGGKIDTDFLSDCIDEGFLSLKGDRYFLNLELEEQ